MINEIERKFLVDKMPDLTELEWMETLNISQVYLATGKDHIRIREVVHSTGTDYYLTIKRGSGLIRKEMELPIDRETYFEWTRQNNLPELRKVRHIIVEDGLKVEIDVYNKFNLIVAEVEFPDDREAYYFLPPYWFGTDITGVKEYENQYLWQVLQKAKHN